MPSGEDCLIICQPTLCSSTYCLQILHIQWMGVFFGGGVNLSSVPISACNLISGKLQSKAVGIFFSYKKRYNNKTTKSSDGIRAKK